MRNKLSLAGSLTAGLLSLAASAQATLAAPLNSGLSGSSAESLPSLASQPTLRSLLPDDSLQEFCRDVRINAIVVPGFCTLIVQARIQYQQGNLQSAAELYNQALRHKPLYSRGYYNRGVIYLSLGQSSQAKADLDQAARLFKQQRDLTNFQRTVALLATLGS